MNDKLLPLQGVRIIETSDILALPMATTVKIKGASGENTLQRGKYGQLRIKSLRLYDTNNR